MRVCVCMQMYGADYEIDKQGRLRNGIIAGKEFSR